MMTVTKKRRRGKKRRNTNIKNPEERDLPANLRLEVKDHGLMTEDIILLQEDSVLQQILLQEGREDHHQTHLPDVEDLHPVHLLDTENLPPVPHKEEESLLQILQEEEGLHQ